MRSSTGLVDRAAILAAYDEWEAAQEKIAALPIDALTPADLVDLLARRERVVRKQGTEDDALLARLDAEVAPRDLGASSLRELLSTRLRISRAEALRRIANAHELGPRRSMAGEPLAPRWAVTAAAQARANSAFSDRNPYPG